MTITLKMTTSAFRRACLRSFATDTYLELEYYSTYLSTLQVSDSLLLLLTITAITTSNSDLACKRLELDKQLAATANNKQQRQE